LKLKEARDYAKGRIKSKKTKKLGELTSLLTAASEILLKFRY